MSDEGKDVAAISQRILAENSHFFFDPDEVSVTATHADNLVQLQAGAMPGAGRPGQIFRLELEAQLGIFARARQKKDEHKDQEPSFRLSMVSVNEIAF